MKTTNWPQAIKPLLAKYKGKKHPLDYKNTYQLLVMVVLSARDSDRHINSLAPELFKDFPDMQALAATNSAALMKHIKKVSGSANKAEWLLKIAKEVKRDKSIPLTMEGLTALPGIGRKSANVIMRETGVKAEGIMVDLHVVRVAPRLGIAKGTDPKKLEAQMMEALPQDMWGETGMAISHLGREICRPSNPKHDECVMNSVCEYCLSGAGALAASGPKPTKEKKVVKKAAKKTVKKATAKKVVVKKSPVKKTITKKAVTKRVIVKGSIAKKGVKRKS
ncbi:MAG: endonuclease [Bacteroidetes bacterium]|jgi:endonuclease-3|nr:endonuclease [Bacteroidota bacterium]